MTSTPLPEQGGFNERLESILEQHREWMRGIRTDRLVGTSSKETADAIRALILEEIIGEDEPMFAVNDKDPLEVDIMRSSRNYHRAGQRKKLEDTHGTK